MSWFAVAGAVIGAGASIYGANKNAKALEKGGDAATAFQYDAMNTSIALSRPQLEVANSALGVLAGLFGLQAPSQIDFDSLTSNLVGQAPATGSEIAQAYRDVFGREPDAEGLQWYLQNGYTVDQFKAEARGSAEYRDKFERGVLPDAEINGTTIDNDTGQVVGPGALDLNALVTNNPLIEFSRQQGEQAIDRAAAARGLNASGGTLKDLATFNQDLANTGVERFVLNPLFELAGFGPRASSQINSAAQSGAANLGNIAMGNANARGSAYQNTYNTLGNLAVDVGGYLRERNKD